MSYSFGVSAATKDEAKAKAAKELDQIVTAQPIHTEDRNCILDNIDAALSVLADNNMMDVGLSCSGSLQWVGGVGNEHITAVHMSISAYHVIKAS